MGKDRSPWKMHLFLLLLISPIRFARFPQGFGAVVERFVGGNPWERRGGSKERKKKRWLVWRSNEREEAVLVAGLKEWMWAGWMGLGLPMADLASMPLPIPIFFFQVLHSPLL